MVAALQCSPAVPTAPYPDVPTPSPQVGETERRFSRTSDYTGFGDHVSGQP